MAIGAWVTIQNIEAPNDGNVCFLVSIAATWPAQNAVQYFDGSVYTDAAAQELAKRPWPPQSEVKIITALEIPAPVGMEPWAISPDYFENLETALRPAAQAVLDSALLKLKSITDKTLKISSEIIQGSPAPVIVDEAEQALMNSVAGRATVAAVKQHNHDVDPIHPHMHFEIDLGLDSLARTECFASVEQTLGIELDSQELSTIQRVGELVQLATSRLNGGARSPGTPGGEFRWQKELAPKSETRPDVEQLLKRKTAVVLFASVVLRIIRIAAQVLFCMEVRGKEVLDIPHIIGSPWPRLRSTFSPRYRWQVMFPALLPLNA